MTNTCRTIGRSLAGLALIFLLAAPAAAEPIKYAMVNAVFGDGGSRSGNARRSDPDGTSLTPASLGRGPAITVNNRTLFFWPISGTTVSTWVFAADGPNLVSVDHMTAHIVPSP